MERFGEVVRAEYRAIGIHMALSPMADLATGPRWSRINGTFGEDADLAKRMGHAYIKGFQKGVSGLKSDSVATVVKHWVRVPRYSYRTIDRLSPDCRRTFPASGANVRW